LRGSTSRMKEAHSSGYRFHFSRKPSMIPLD
jgi:hypothetical protein